MILTVLLLCSLCQVNKTQRDSELISRPAFLDNGKCWVEGKRFHIQGFGYERWDTCRKGKWYNGVTTQIPRFELEYPNLEFDIINFDPNSGHLIIPTSAEIRIQNKDGSWGPWLKSKETK